MYKSDEELIKGCMRQDPLCQSQLYQKYSRRLMTVCLRYAHTNFEAEDVFHEAFIKVFANLHKYEGKGSFEGWMRHIFVNTAITAFHKNRKHQASAELTQVPEATSNEVDALSSLTADEIMALVQRLPPGYRIVFNMYVVDGFSHKEIGEMLNISEGTSKSQLARAKQFLKRWIIEQNPAFHAER